MKLRSTLCALATVMTAGMMGCGSQPEYYRVAIDLSPLGSLPGTCYDSGTAPAPSDTTTHVVDVGQWIIWDGAEDQKYLQVGNIDYRLGDTRVVITTGDAIVSSEGDKPTFVTERTQTSPNRTSRATYTFDKLGETAEGTLALSFVCTGTGCDPNCDATLHFVGRRLKVDPILAVGDTAN